MVLTYPVLGTPTSAHECCVTIRRGRGEHSLWSLVGDGVGHGANCNWDVGVGRPERECREV
eukprot:4858389-Prymnesium_polylepis.2